MSVTEQFTTEYPSCTVVNDVEVWRCRCRYWSIIVTSTTTSKTREEDWPKREAWFVRNCGICKTMPLRDGREIYGGPRLPES